MSDLSGHRDSVAFSQSIQPGGVNAATPARPARRVGQAGPAGRCAPLLPLLAMYVATIILCACTTLAARNTSTPESVYSLAQLQTRLASNPGAWVGRIVLIRAIAEPCPVWGSLHSPLHCTVFAPDLVDPDGTSLTEPMPLALSTGSTVLATLRRLPFASGMLPPAPLPPWEVLRTYRVRLRTLSKAHCGPTPCFEAELLDVRP